MSLNIKSQVLTGPYTSWQIGGPAEYFCEPTDIEELRNCNAWARQKNLAVTTIGGGSNILISDEGISGLVICLRRLSKIEFQVNETTQNLEIEALAGVKKSELLKIFLKYKMAPALFLAGLPGDVAGGIVMNAGVSEAFVPKEFSELVNWFEVLKPEGSIVRYEHSDIQWYYRKAEGWQPGIIVRAGLSWVLSPKEHILKEVKEANRIRLIKQPLDMPSCGSVFKNPTGLKAAQLIDKAGLKGYSIGEAQVSLKHANFIVNLGNASARDTWELMMKVQNEVLYQFGVRLESEVVRIGKW